MIEQNKKLQLAVQFATTAHAGQFRKGDKGGIQIPYIVHPLDVMREVFSFGICKPEHLYILQAAVLHDVIEDTDYTSGTLLDMFGQHVTSIVEELSFRDRREDEEPRDYQRAKSEHLAEFVNKSPEALLIKIADRIRNCLDFDIMDRVYAGKYFNRAEGLWSAFANRKDEIEQIFGTHVYGVADDKRKALAMLLESRKPRLF